ncbi:hypothetical protein DFH11DRAFT_865205 [Phellopilus nigrolimitatus]|nr:hypothetical protein DFH11DRAFT_865205 [Phellopilus nigrolimitatus]
MNVEQPHGARRSSYDILVKTTDIAPSSNSKDDPPAVEGPDLSGGMMTKDGVSIPSRDDLSAVDEPDLRENPMTIKDNDAPLCKVGGTEAQRCVDEDASDPRSLDAIMGEHVEDTIIDQQVEQDPEVREAEHRQNVNESSHSEGVSDNLANPAGLPPVAANGFSGPQVSTMNGMGAEASSGVSRMDDRPPPSSSGISSVDTEDEAQRKAPLHAAVGHSLSNSPAATPEPSHSDSSPPLSLDGSPSPSPPSPDASNGWLSLGAVIPKSYVDGTQKLFSSAKRHIGLGFKAKILPIEQPTAQSHPKGEEILRLVFLDKANKCSEGELIDLCIALNGRVDTLVINMQDEWDKVQDKARESDARSITLGESPSVALGSDALLSNTAITELVITALGSEIHKALTDPNHEGPDFDAVVQDALQAWATFCVYLAIQPLLFGFKLRTQKDVEEAIRRMKIHGQLDEARFYQKSH